MLICIAVIWLAHPALGTAAAAAAALVLALAVLNDRFTRSGIDALQQHADGGTVREVLVRDGERVREGQPLLVLGDVSVDADLNRLSFRVRSERISVTRLEAEQSMSRSLAFAPDLLAAAATDLRLAELMTKEKALFDVRRDALHGQVALLRAQREKVAQEIVALRAQIDQAVESAKFQRAELETNRDLAKEKFISPTRIAQLEGSVADYGVKIEERRFELARAEQRGVDTDLRIQTLESEFRRQASDELKVTSARLSEVEQELRKFTDASMRQVIMAPTDGEVIDLKYSAPGAVIPPREVIAEIVPTQTRLVTEARIRAEDINRIHRGQSADIRFTAFMYRTTKLVEGRVVYVSADRLLDRATGAPYYTVLVEADSSSLAEAGELKLQAGMPAEVYIKAEERTPLQYLLEPLTQVFRRALRER